MPPNKILQGRCVKPGASFQSVFFKKRTKFLVIEKLTNTTKSKDISGQRLKEKIFGFKRWKRYTQKD